MRLTAREMVNASYALMTGVTLNYLPGQEPYRNAITMCNEVLDELWGMFPWTYYRTTVQIEPERFERTYTYDTDLHSVRRLDDTIRLMKDNGDFVCVVTNVPITDIDRLGHERDLYVAIGEGYIVFNREFTARELSYVIEMDLQREPKHLTVPVPGAEDDDPSQNQVVDFYDSSIIKKGVCAWMTENDNVRQAQYQLKRAKFDKRYYELSASDAAYITPAKRFDFHMPQLQKGYWSSNANSDMRGMPKANGAQNGWY